MSDGLASSGNESQDADEAELVRSYESAMDAWKRGELPGFTSEAEFIRYAAGHS